MVFDLPKLCTPRGSGHRCYIPERHGDHHRLRIGSRWVIMMFEEFYRPVRLGFVVVIGYVWHVPGRRLRSARRQVRNSSPARGLVAFEGAGLPR